jgi:hypothetical protein
MLRDHEKLKGLSYITKGHREFKEHMGMGSLCCNTLDLFCRQLLERMPKPQRGVLRVGRMRQTISRVKKET